MYQFAKKIGFITRKTPPGGSLPDFDLTDFKLTIPLAAPDQKVDAALDPESSRLVKNAEEILSGFYHPFGGEKHPLSLTFLSTPSAHWTSFGDTVDGQDIKWIWEPARFSWAFDLARAYLVQPDDRFVKCFWDGFTEFTQSNPVNCGPNWASAQEAAMRIITWSMVFQVFKDSPATTPENVLNLSKALWQQAARIPPTLSYARSQNNNHHLSEALGLIVAGAIFKNQSVQARKWLELGFKEFNRGLLKQIEPDGTYGQHSANYHRLMLQLSLIYYAYAKSLNVEIPTEVSERLAAATRWMTAQLDPISGRLPNLGHNDGTLLMPMGCAEYRDYRPTAQAASLAFLGKAFLPSGQWDELSAWLSLTAQKSCKEPLPACSPAVHNITNEKSWVTLRGVQFHGRPAHADQLHLEFWWDGINISQDAGTFSYNNPPPWKNPFSSTLVHNTISVDEKDQMQQAGKFLWLNQAQAKWLLTKEAAVLSASHDGYRKIGVIHERTAKYTEKGQLRVVDEIRFTGSSKTQAVTLHWLLPDWTWKLDHQTLLLEDDNHQVQIILSASKIAGETLVSAEDLSLIRSGETLHGKRRSPILGWVSDTYGVKNPALSFSAIWQTDTDLKIITDWKCKLQPAARKG